MRLVFFLWVVLVASVEAKYANDGFVRSPTCFESTNCSQACSRSNQYSWFPSGWCASWLRNCYQPFDGCLSSSFVFGVTMNYSTSNYPQFGYRLPLRLDF